MGVYRRGNVYWIDFRFGGKRYQQSSNSSQKDIALRAERNLRTSLEKGVNGIQDAVVMEQFSKAITEWVELEKQSWSKATYIWHRNNISHLVSYFGKQLIHTITATDVKQYRAGRQASMSTKTGDVLSNTTLNAEYASLRQFMISRGLWTKLKEGSKLRRLPQNDEIGRWLEDDECIRLLQACKESGSRALYPAVLLSILTGLRFIELQHLTWDAIFFDKGFLEVRRSKTKGGKGRHVDLHEDAIDLLRTWKVNFPDAPRTGYVFPARVYGWGDCKVPTEVDYSKPMSKMSGSWVAAKKVAGVECRWHDLRHSCASRLAAGGATDQTLQALLGWCSPKMIQRYSHVREQARKAAVENAFGNWHVLEQQKVVEAPVLQLTA